MSKKYRFFYAADVITVLAEEALGPVTNGSLNKCIDDFEAALTSSKITQKEQKDLTFKFVESFDRKEPIDGETNNEDDLVIPATDFKLSADPKPLPPGEDPDPTKATMSGRAWIYGGAKFEESLLLQDSLYMSLGLLIDSDLAAVRKKVTFRRYRTFAAAASLEIFSEASFKWKPTDPNKTQKKLQ